MTLNEYLTSIADAIRAKNKSTDKIKAEGFAGEILSLKTGSSGSVMKKDVNFYDYEGTLLHSYTLAEAQMLTALPELPERNGLTAQEWNYTLEEIKSYDRPVDVGAIYTTDDGASRFYVTIDAEYRKNVNFGFQISVANGATMDWGDGSAPETISTASWAWYPHTYENFGSYVIKITPIDGCTLKFGEGSATSFQIIGSSLKKAEFGNGVTHINFDSCLSLKEVVIPNSVTTVSTNCFKSCKQLQTVVLPKNVKFDNGSCYFDGSAVNKVILPHTFTGTLESAFQNCKALCDIVLPNNGNISSASLAFSACENLDNVVLPSNMTKIYYRMFYGNAGLINLNIPNNIESIDSEAFADCIRLQKITLPNSLISIASSAFNNASRLKEVDCAALDHVPSISSSSFAGCSNNELKFYVPSALYDEWIAASNWSSLASKIVAV